MLTGKSTINRKGEYIINSFKPSGNRAIGINCPDKKILKTLYDTIRALTSPNQKPTQTIEKYVEYDKNTDINNVIKKPNICGIPLKIYPGPKIKGISIIMVK